MEREQLERLLCDGDDTSSAALTALRAGASCVIWDGTTSSKSLATVYARRLRHTVRRGIAEQVAEVVRGEFAVQAGACDKESDRCVDLAARCEGEGVGQGAFQGGFVASGQDVAAYVQEVDGRGGQVADQFFQLAGDAFRALVRVE
jgi:hypothetical protein